jgi:uncharacterized protein
MTQERRETAGVSVLAAALTALAGWMAWRSGLRGAEWSASSGSFALLLAPYALIGSRGIVDRASAWLEVKPARIWFVPLGLTVPYFLVAAGRKEFLLPGFFTLAVFVMTPTLLVFIGRGAEKGRFWPDILAALAIWLPFDFRWMNAAWPGRFGQACNTLLAVDLALILFLVFRRLPGLGFDFRLDGFKMKQGLFHFLAFAPIAVPVGLATGFLTWSPDVSGPELLFQRACLIFFLTALPEELLQNALTRMTGSPGRGLLAASVIFGAAHLNNMPFPHNLVYFILAAIAGFFYGRAYQKTGTLMAGAITHTLVDWVWLELFR